ncbi:MAG: DNA replication/repair protein RecF [Moraxellaceae bacterium]
MIERLQISNLRNLTQVNLQSTACNVIIGENGSGKTSLLEAIFLLSRGKSFRHHQPKRYIQHHKKSAVVYAKINDSNALAIQKKTDATTLLRLNQTTVYNQSILTEQLPTLLIDPSTMDMLEQGSASRRQLLDWLVFHMKQGFHSQWVAYQRLLKQRNSLLKSTRRLTQVQLDELKSWDKGLGNHAALIHYYRERIFTEWQPCFFDSVAQLLPDYAAQLSLSYHAGYDTSVALDVQLNERLEQDLQLGYTRIGNHRADIHVHWHSNDSIDKDHEEKPSSFHTDTSTKLPVLKEQAANVLSRGEKKLLITALRLSQLPLLLRTEPHTDFSRDGMGSEATPVVLLDDITAELDGRAIEILLSNLAQLPCQVFMTSLTDEIVPLVKKLWSDSIVFHVKQGQITSDR